MWKAAQRRGEEWAEKWDWSDYFDWLEPRLFHPGRWAVVPDMPGAPSQLNDALLLDWPFGQKGAPLWHMDAPIERLLALCSKWDRVCLGWTGAGKHLDRPEFHARMAEVDKALGNSWPVLHMMRGIKVAFDYPFVSADGTTLAQNGWRYDTSFDFGDRWAGRKAYADRLDRRNGDTFRRSSQSGNRGRSRAHLEDHGLGGGRAQQDAGCDLFAALDGEMAGATQRHLPA
jgi:hypothetical protein